MTTVYYVVNPATPHGRAVIGFGRAFLSFVHEVLRSYRLNDLRYVVFTDADGATYPERYTRDEKVLKLIDALRRNAGVCLDLPTGLYDTNERAVILCLRLYKPKDKVVSLRASAHEFIHFMTVPNDSIIIDGFVRALAYDCPEFKDVVDVIMACRDKVGELGGLSSEARKKLAEMLSDLRMLEDMCAHSFSQFRTASWIFVTQMVAEYITLNYFVLLQRLPVLSIKSILAMPYEYKYYVEYQLNNYMHTVTRVATVSAYAYHRLAHPEKPASEAQDFGRVMDEKVGSLWKKLWYGDQPKMKGFMHEVFLSILEKRTVFPVDVAPKYPEIYYEVMYLAPKPVI